MLKPLGIAFGGLFSYFEPDEKIARQEEAGIRDWKGGALPFIPAKDHIPMAPLEPALEKFLSHFWKPGIKPAAPPRARSPLMGSHRPGTGVPDLPFYRPIPAPSQNPLPAAFQDKAPHLAGIARDWQAMLDLKRVIAYGFRGDKRDPGTIRAAGGFHPPATRQDDHYLYGAVFEQFKDYLQKRYNKTITLDEYKNALSKAMDTQSRELFLEYSIWRAIIGQEALHLGRMLANEALKGYISTTKAVTVAKGFGEGGWVYCTLVRGGYLVPEKGKHKWTTIFGEEEIAFPGSIPWENVAACRKVNDSRKFDGPIFMRPGFEREDPAASQQIYELLSGKKQS